MTRLLVPTLLAIAAPAAAAPCEVSIVRAPSGVGEIIQSWVGREASCATKLEVRVIAQTDGNLYIIARDDRGRLHERVVPTAENAAVLIASWVADDRVDTGAGAAVFGEPAPDPVPETPDEQPIAGPSMVEPERRAQDRHDANPEPAISASHEVGSTSPRYVSFGVQAGMSNGGGFGVRGEWDFWRSRSDRWVVTAVGSGSGSSVSFMTASVDTQLDMFDLQASLSIGRVGRFGKWQVRGSLGAGLVLTAAHQADTTNASASTVSPVFELGVRLAREFAPGWSIGFAPLAKVYLQSLEVPASYGPTYIESMSRKPELAGYLSLMHRM